MISEGVQPPLKALAETGTHFAHAYSTSAVVLITIRQTCANRIGVVATGLSATEMLRCYWFAGSESVNETMPSQ